jgi:hypothetical protein
MLNHYNLIYSSVLNLFKQSNTLLIYILEDFKFCLPEMLKAQAKVLLKQFSFT